MGNFDIHQRSEDIVDQYIVFDLMQLLKMSRVLEEDWKKAEKAYLSDSSTTNEARMINAFDQMQLAKKAVEDELTRLDTQEPLNKQRYDQ